MQIRFLAIALLLLGPVASMAADIYPATIQPTQPITISENERALSYSAQQHVPVAQPQQVYAVPAHAPEPEPQSPPPFKVDFLQLCNF